MADEEKEKLPYLVYRMCNPAVKVKGKTLSGFCSNPGTCTVCGYYWGPGRKDDLVGTIPYWAKSQIELKRRKEGE